MATPLTGALQHEVVALRPNRAQRNHSMLHVDTPSDDLLKDVRAHLVKRGTSLAAFCKEHGFTRQAVTLAISGQRNGPQSRALLMRFLAKVRETA
jgi:lambda repressor-like predicted transcriptional regulator